MKFLFVKPVFGLIILAVMTLIGLLRGKPAFAYRHDRAHFRSLPRPPLRFPPTRRPARPYPPAQPPQWGQPPLSR